MRRARAAHARWLGLDATDRGRTLDALARRSSSPRDGEPRADRRLRQRKARSRTQPDLRRRSRPKQARIARGRRRPAARCACAAVSAALLTLAAPVLRAYAGHKERGRPARLRRPDRPDLARCWSIPAPPGCCTSSTAASTTCCSTRCRTPRPRSGDIAQALTEEFFAGAGAARTQPHRLRGRRPQAVDLLLPGRRPRRVRPLARRAGAAGAAARARPSATSPLDVSFRSTAPVLALVDAVFADPVAAAGVVEPGAALTPSTPTAPAMPAASSCGRWRRCRTQREPEPWTVPERNQALRSRAAAAGRDAGGAGSTSRPAARVLLESRGRPLAPGRRAGAGAAPQRLRPRAGARAEIARRRRSPGWIGWC